MWNYWLGGRDYFAADRAAAEQLSREFPHLAQAARAERAFLVRAVRFLAGPARIRQFLDIGAGLPADGNTHEIAQRVAPDAGILYLDNDPAVLLHAHTLLRRPDLASTPEGMVSYLDADLRNVPAVLASAAGLLDRRQPAAVIMLGVLGHIGDHGAARSITSQLMDAFPSGSYLAIADAVSGRQDTGSAQRPVQRRGGGALPPAPSGRAGQLLRRAGAGRAGRRAVPAVEAGRGHRVAGRRGGLLRGGQEALTAVHATVHPYATNRRYSGILRKDSPPTRMISVKFPRDMASTLNS